MTCCGNLIEITTLDGPECFLCQCCGRQGPASAFPDPPDEPAYSLDPPKPSLLKRMRRKLASLITRK